MPDADITRAADAVKAAGLDCSQERDDLFYASLDHSRYSFMPALRVYAHGGGDIAKTLEIASQFKVPITPRGAGTGCAGGCVPVRGSIVLDLSKIDFIEIQPAERVAHVGAGAITAQVDAQAAKHGLMYAPDPSSHKFSTIGGNISCNAGGLRAAKYGNTRENVYALTAYLPDGRRLDCGRALKKFSTGLNLKDFFIGSEGTLGVVGEAWLKLVPRPESRAVAIAFPNSDAAAFDAVEKLMLSPLTPAICEFMDAETLSCVLRRNPDTDLKIPAGAAVLLLEFDGSREQAKADAVFAEKLLSEYSARAARDDSEAESFWKIRRSASQSMYLLADSKVNQDIVLPFSAVRGYFDFYKKLSVRYGLPSPVFGHAGDGNYHIHFMYESGEAGARERAWEAMGKAVRKAIEMGGAVSGEHGIGFLKSKYMPYQHTREELEVMRAIKRQFDPNNILNPDKVYFPDVVSPTNPLTNVKLPWD